MPVAQLGARQSILSAATTRPATSRPSRCVPASSSMQANHAGHGRATNRGSGAGGGRGAGGLKGGGRRFECPPGGEAADKQASFASPFPEDPVTAIVGGGLSGLVCALELARAGLRSAVGDVLLVASAGRAMPTSSAFILLS